MLWGLHCQRLDRRYMGTIKLGDRLVAASYKSLQVCTALCHARARDELVSLNDLPKILSYTDS